AFGAETSWKTSPVSAPTGSAAWMYSSIVKFPASGGVVWYAPQYLPGKAGWGEDIPEQFLKLPKTKVSAFQSGGAPPKLVDCELQGALWYHYGAAPFADKNGHGCNCQAGRFDVDDFGRSFFPDAGRFRVGVLDTNGNPITEFGHYGNRDCGGPGSAIPDPEIAFAYPYTVALSRTHVFVGDLLNRRIAKIRMSYAASETCSVE